MNYSSRLTCFIDVLGFKSVIDQSLSTTEVTEALFELISELQPKNITNAMYRAIPNYSFKDDKVIVTPSNPDTTSEAWPIEITQFSDSFVLSCPSDNCGSCELLIETMLLLIFMFYNRLSLLARGGLTIGPLIHDPKGVVFGPALNEAYRLESEIAKYPRIIINIEKFKELNDILKKHPLLNLFSKEGDFFATNLTALTKWYRTQEMISLQQIKDFSSQSKRDYSKDKKISEKYQYLYDACEIMTKDNTIVRS